MTVQPSVEEPAFDPEVGVSPADVEAAIRVANAYSVVSDDYDPFSQIWNERNGRWQDRYNYVTGSDFIGVDEFGNGVFEDHDRDRGSIPLAFITTPRSQFTAAWEIKRQTKIDQFAAARDAAEIKERSRLEEQSRAAHLRQKARDRALRQAISDPITFTPRGVNPEGDNAEDLTSWQARAVFLALALTEE